MLRCPMSKAHADFGSVSLQSAGHYTQAWCSSRRALSSLSQYANLEREDCDSPESRPDESKLTGEFDYLPQ